MNDFPKQLLLSVFFVLVFSPGGCPLLAGEADEPVSVKDDGSEEKDAGEEQVSPLDYYRSIGLKYFLEKNYQAALKEFIKILDIEPVDRQALQYVELCARQMRLAKDGLFREEIVSRAKEVQKMRSRYVGDLGKIKEIKIEDKGIEFFLGLDTSYFFRPYTATFREESYRVLDKLRNLLKYIGHHQLTLEIKHPPDLDKSVEVKRTLALMSYLIAKDREGER